MARAVLHDAHTREVIDAEEMSEMIGSMAEHVANGGKIITSIEPSQGRLPEVGNRIPVSGVVFELVRETNHAEFIKEIPPWTTPEQALSAKTTIRDIPGVKFFEVMIVD